MPLTAKQRRELLLAEIGWLACVERKPLDHIAELLGLSCAEEVRIILHEWAKKQPAEVLPLAHGAN